MLDELIALREVTRRPRPSDPWFDAECRAAKRQTRRLGRAHVRAASRGSSTPQSVAIEQVAAARSAFMRIQHEGASIITQPVADYDISGLRRR